MSQDSDCNAIYVDNNLQLKELCKEWHKVPFIALDTEFIRTDTFYPIAGLLQLSDGQSSYLIDPLTIDQWDDFIRVLVDPNIIKVLHSCSEDLEVFDRMFSTLPAPIFDTQIAAAMIGLGFSLSYQRLVDALLSIHVEKGETRSNWLQRPLTESQRHYAALDVEHLPHVYRLLDTQLIEKNRRSWLDHECNKMLTAFYNSEPYYKKVKSAWKLSPAQLCILVALIEWRENEARQRNVPRGRVLKDRCCYDIAMKSPNTIQRLAAVDEVGPKIIRIDGQNILDIVSEANSVSSDQYPRRLEKPLPVQMGGVLKQLKALTLAIAQELCIAPEILVKKRDYEALLKSGMSGGGYQLPESLLGWRKEVVGNTLLSSLLK